MKMFSIVALSIVLCIASLSTASAHNASAEKLASGVQDLVTAPVGLFTHTSDRVNTSDDKICALFFGLVEGVDTAVSKTITGFVNILTFPFASHP